MRRLLASLILALTLAVGNTVDPTVPPSRDDLQIRNQAGGTPTTTTAATTITEAPAPVPTLQKRGLIDTCGVVPGTTLYCHPSQGACVWESGSSGRFGCCTVDTSGIAVSCTLPTACVNYLAWSLYHQTRTLDPETHYCTQLNRPQCQRRVLHGYLTRPGGIIESGAWTVQGCGTITTTAYGSVWTDEFDVDEDPNPLWSQNMRIQPKPGAQVLKADASFAVNSLPLPADKKITDLPPSKKNLFDPGLSAFQKKDTHGLILGAKRSSNIQDLESRLEVKFVNPLWAVNMPIAPKDGDPVINFDLDPIRLDPDEEALAVSIFLHFRPRYLEFLRNTVLRRRDAESTTDDDVPIILFLVDMYQLIALNLDYFATARDIDTYTGSFEVVPVTVTVSDGGFVPGFTTVLQVTRIATIGDAVTPTATLQPTDETANPTASATGVDAANASQTCANGSVIPATLECDAARATRSARLLWPICFALAVIVVVPAFAGVVL